MTRFLLALLLILGAQIAGAQQITPGGGGGGGAGGTTNATIVAPLGAQAGAASVSTVLATDQVPIAVKQPDTVVTPNTVAAQTLNSQANISLGNGIQSVIYTTSGLTGTGAVITVVGTNTGGTPATATNGVSQTNGGPVSTTTVDLVNFCVNVGGLTSVGLKVTTAGSTATVNITAIATVSQCGANTIPTSGAGLVVTSPATAASNGAVTPAVVDKTGRQIVIQNTNPENIVRGLITTAMTGTTTTAVTGMGAPSAGLRNYISSCSISNSHATVGTDVVLQDGSGGATFWTFPAAANYGGSNLSFPTPIPQPTLATALFAANVTTGSSTKLSCVGFTAP